MTAPNDHDENEFSFFGLLVFAVVVSLFVFVGTRAGTRGIGVSVLIGAIQFRGRMPYGWEGGPPSGHITGPLAIFMNVLFGIFGLWMLIWPDAAMDIFGWSLK